MASLLGTIYAAVAWLWVQYLPGYFLSRALIPDARGPERHGVALFCAFSTFPLAIFLLTVAAGIPLDAPLMFAAGSAANLAGFFLVAPKRADLDLGRRDTGLVLALFAFCAVFLAFCVRSLDGGDVFSTVHHCLYVIVMHTIGNDPSIAMPFYDGLSDGVMHYLVHHPTSEFNGLAPLFFEQRLGNAAILAPSVTLFGTAGWYITAVFATVVYGVCVYLIGRELGAKPLSAAIAAVLFCWGMRLFCMYFVNENNYAVALVAFLLWAALRRKTSTGWVILMGITAGHLVGVRYTSSLFWPALALAVLWHPDPWADRLRRFGIGATLAILTLLPWLYVNFIMLGSPITHPKVHSQFAGRIVINELMGKQFEFRALNWPFIDQVSRTAWNPFPTFLWLPLTVARCFGHMAMAVAALGWWRALKQRRAFAILLAFAIPHTVAMCLMETLDWEQLTYAAPGLVPLGAALALGLDALIAPLRAKAETANGVLKKDWQRSVAFAAVALVVLSGSFRAVRATTWPVDTRSLVQRHWPEPPPLDKGAIAVAEDLTSFSPLPMMPVVRTSFAGFTWRAMAHILDTGDIAVESDGLPVYPSGHVAMLAGYSARSAMDYHFRMAGRDPKTADATVRGSLGLHMVTLRLPAEQASVKVTRNLGNYNVAVKMAKAGPERDYTFFLHPWFPPVKTVKVSLDGRPIEDLRVVNYGGTADEGEERFLVTNYSREIVDTVDVDYTVDLNGEPAYCGLFVFTTGVDLEQVETVVLAGGHDQTWTGKTQGTLRIPRNLTADSVFLYSEPYCSDHVPQPGDRYGVATGPFEKGTKLHFTLDRMW